MICDQTYNASFDRKRESIQYSACLVITGTIRDTSYETVNQELGLERPNRLDQILWQNH